MCDAQAFVLWYVYPRNSHTQFFHNASLDKEAGSVLISVAENGKTSPMYEPQHEMSNEILQAPILRGRNGLKIVIVASTFNKKYTDALVENCRGELDRVAPGVAVTVVRIPGAFEIPMVVNRELQREGKPDAIIALGVIIRGSTAHADLIGEAVTRELLRASCDHLTPVIHEVLLLENEEQAEERCCGEALNRGREAARTAISMLALAHQ